MTLLIALIATAVATVLGTLAAIGIHAMKSRNANMIMSISYLPMTTPDIVTGVSLMLMFVFIKIPLGYGTMLLGPHRVRHALRAVFGAAKAQADEREPLRGGAGSGLSRRCGRCGKVILPEIMPGVVTGALLAFTMSLDDFVISYFTSNTDKNLSIIIYAAARKGIEPTIYALSTLMFVVVLVLLLIVNKRSALENVS